jgi:glycosyltransferase involved in cell wall biosynthesis
MMLPIISVCIPTYNHEKFIAQCLESVLNQKDAPPFIISISDDCSTDKTTEILKHYKDRYPDKIQLNLRTENAGMVKNITGNIYSCNSEYIALLEGDDFWCDEYKLKNQFEILTQDKSIGFVCSSQIVLNSDRQKLNVLYDNAFSFTIDDFIYKNLKIFNNTKLFRRSVLPDILPDWYYKSHLWDWLMHIFMLERGNGYYDPSPTLMYRRHENAYISEKNTISRMSDCLIVLPLLDKYLKNKYTEILCDTSSHFMELSVAYFKERNYLSFLKYTFLCITKSKKFRLRDFIWKLRH